MKSIYDDVDWQDISSVDIKQIKFEVRNWQKDWEYLQSVKKLVSEHTQLKAEFIKADLDCDYDSTLTFKTVFDKWIGGRIQMVLDRGKDW